MSRGFIRPIGELERTSRTLGFALDPEHIIERELMGLVADLAYVCGTLQDRVALLEKKHSTAENAEGAEVRS